MAMNFPTDRANLNPALPAGALQNGDTTLINNILYTYVVDGTNSWWTANTGGSAESLWALDGTTIQPKEDTHGVEIGGGDIQLNADGSAEFGSGNIFLSAAGRIDGATALRLSSTTPADGIYVGQGGSGASGWNARITGGGAAYFGGNETAGANISLNADGTAEFAGDVKTSSWLTALRVYVGTPAVANQSINASPYGTGSNTLYIGNQSISTSVRSVLWLEPNNPANYTTTTDSEGVETRVYNGPTLDVKERIQNLLTRLDAIEANEVIDDATDSSLLTLLASATSRLDNIESEITSIKSRLDAAGI